MFLQLTHHQPPPHRHTHTAWPKRPATRAPSRPMSTTVRVCVCVCLFVWSCALPHLPLPPSPHHIPPPLIESPTQPPTHPLTANTHHGFKKTWLMDGATYPSKLCVCVCKLLLPSTSLQPIHLSPYLPTPPHNHNQQQSLSLSPLRSPCAQVSPPTSSCLLLVRGCPLSF